MDHPPPADAPGDDADTPLPPELAFDPVPSQTNRSDGWTPARQRRFIAALAETGSAKAAARRAGMTPEGVYQLRRRPGAESFARAWARALDMGVERIEDIAMDRAIHGVEMPVYSYGRLVGTRTRYNDRLLMFILRSRRPDRFGSARGPLRPGDPEYERLRREWEAEAAEAAAAEEAAAAADLDARLEALRTQLLARRAERQADED